MGTAKARHLERIARHLTLMDRVTSRRVPWAPNTEQLALWRLLDEHHATIIAKPRKTGISTACTLPEVVDAMASDAEGETVYYVCAIDTDEKAEQQAKTAIDFARQLGAPARAHGNGLLFPRSRSEVVYVTAGGRLAGRGSSIHRLRVTELPFWRTPRESYQSLRSACADSATIIIETTMDIDRDGFTRALWRGSMRDPFSSQQIPIGVEFHRHFFKVEDQASYRLPTDAISDDEWKMCQERHGFTDRAHAAWWLRHALVNLCQGDETRLMHDYPQIEDHLFAAASGRVITTTPRIAPVVERIDVHGLAGKLWQVEVYIPPEQCSGAFFVTVDTAWGANKTRSTVMVTDVADGRILACFCSPIVMYDDLARIAQRARQVYADRMPKVPLVRPRSECIIEINGSGNATAHEATKIGLPFIAMDQVKNHHTHGQDACVKHAKRMIETPGPEGSIVAGPPELAEECDALQKVNGNYVGMKDLVMTYGMALLKRVELGVRDDRWKAKRYDVNIIRAEDRMRDQRTVARRESWSVPRR